MAGQVPDSGYKKDIVGPGSGGGGGASPATTAPPEVQAASVLGVSLLYAREDHTHQSPTVYLPSGAGVSTNILGNRSANNAPTDLASIGIVNFGSKTAGASTGVSGAYCSLLGGDRNSLTSGYGFLGGGRNNTVTANYAVLVGGNNNSILSTNTDSTDSFIGAGDSNVIDDSTHAFIGGGSGNTNSGSYGAIVGGENNSLAISGSAPTRSFIGAGTTNVISGQVSCAIVAGQGNIINDSVGLASWSFIGAGNLNNIFLGTGSFIGAGGVNAIRGDFSAIVAGQNNSVLSTSSTAANCGVLSGSTNTVDSATNSIIVAGESNNVLSTKSASANCGVFSGGANTVDSASNSAICAGESNSIGVAAGVSNRDFIGAGAFNSITDSLDSFIGGGESNSLAQANKSAIGGGELNQINPALNTVTHAFLGGGFQNVIDAGLSVFVGGGTNITASGDYAFVGGGLFNEVTPGAGPSDSSGVCSGTGNVVSSARRSFIGGGISNTINSATSDDASTICGGTSNLVQNSSWSFLGGGLLNALADVDYCVIGGGTRNNMTATSGTIPGGERGSCYITGSFVHASGTLNATGDQQYTHVVISGQTPGLTVNESVVLTPRTALGSNVFATIANRAYTVILEVTMARNNLSDARSFLVHALVVTDAANLVTIVAQSILSQLGSAATALYTVTVSAGAAPSRIIVTAATGAGNTHKVIVSCTARMTETANNYP